MWHYVLLYNIIHIFYTLHITLVFFRRTLLDWLDLSHIATTNVTPDLLRTDLIPLSKIPSHLAVVIQYPFLKESPLNFNDIIKDIAQFTCYCVTAGIETLTLYDAEGMLKMNAGKLYKEISIAQRIWLYDEEINSKRQKKDADMPVMHNSTKYVIKDSSINLALQLNLLSEEDGRPLIAEVAKKLCGEVKEGVLRSDEIDVAVVDQYLMDRSITEPQLMILFGESPHDHITLDGFPPWQIRLTEFFNGSKYDRLDYTLFKNSLYRYSKLEQRFGR